MARYLLINFIKSNKTVQNTFIALFFTLFAIYTGFFAFDLFNVVNTSVINAELVKNDTTVEKVTDYELAGDTIRIGNDTYKDIKIVFYGVSTDDKSVYFNKSTSTLIQGLPKGFGVSFLLSSNTFFVLIPLLIVTFLSYKLSSAKNNEFTAFNTYKVFYLFLGISIILVLLVLFSLILLN